MFSNSKNIIEAPICHIEQSRVEAKEKKTEKTNMKLNLN